MPDTQSPVGSFGSTGVKSKSTGLIANCEPPKPSATLVLLVHGIVYPPCPSLCAPGIAAWTASASAWGAMMSVVPVSRIALRPCRPRSCPSALTPSIAASQNPSWLTLSTVTSVLASNLEESSPPKVTSPSFSSSESREILKEVIASSMRPCLASDSGGVSTPSSERV